MKKPRIYTLVFADIYPMYVQKVERKQQDPKNIDKIIYWLSGYDEKGIAQQIENRVDMETFFLEAPNPQANAHLITGVICGYRIEDIEDHIEQQVRYMDKLIDELAKGKTMDKILRQEKN